MEEKEIKTAAEELQEISDYLLLDSRRYDTDIGAGI